VVTRLPTIVWQGARGLWSGRSIEPGRLTAAERRLLEVLGAEGGVGRAGFCGGAGPPQHRPAGGLMLPRRNPLVRASVRLLERDPSWAYPVLLALLGGRDAPPPELRSRWLRGMLQAGED
jgi:hypothetical protein